MAGFFKKVFSFGKKEVEERPAEDQPLAPIDWSALKALRDEPAPTVEPAAEIAPTPPSPSRGGSTDEVGRDGVAETSSADAIPPLDGEGGREATGWGDQKTSPPPPPVGSTPTAEARTQPEAIEPPSPVEIAPTAGAPHPLPDLLPASGEKEEAPTPASPSPRPSRREGKGEAQRDPTPAGKVTVAKTVEQKAAPQPVAAPEPKLSWFQRLRQGLARSSRELSGSIAGVFTRKKLDEETLQDLEDVLIRADLGVETALRVTDSLASSRYGRDVSEAEVRGVMATEIEKVLGPVALPLELDLSHRPHVILVVGVNGTGKTTTIGKLAAKLRQGGLSVMLAAGDTFRAAAIEQLKIWGERTGSPVISSKLGADAAGLAYDAFEKAKEAGSDVLIIDTAGRLQNKTELMAELEKIVRVLGKLDPEAPHTVLQTVDATTGQNALNQVEIFRNVAGVSGLVMTKLDGTARGGILVAIAARHKLPVYFIGVGEQVDDLEPFSAGDFARAIAGV